MLDAHFRYAGWLTLDLRVLGTLVVFSAALGVLVLALSSKTRRWDEYIVGFLAVFALAFLGAWLMTDAAGAPMPLRLETVFPVP